MPLPAFLAGRRPSGPMMMSTAALVVALGGTSYAAATVGTKDIENDAVISPKIADGTIRSIDILDGTIRNDDLAPSAKPRTGPRGPQGRPGEDGADGQDGMDGEDGEDGEDGADGPQGPAGVGRWLLIDRNGNIEDQSGGFSIVTAYDQINNQPGTPTPAIPAGAVGNVYIQSNEPLGNNGIVASIALQNQFEQNNNANVTGRAPGADANPEFSGEITATKCNIPTVVACAPAGANNDNVFVVSPRNSDGSFTQTGAVPADPANPNTHKRFYVIITGDSTDFVGPPVS